MNNYIMEEYKWFKQWPRSADELHELEEFVHSAKEEIKSDFITNPDDIEDINYLYDTSLKINMLLKLKARFSHCKSALLSSDRHFTSRFD